MRRNNFPEVDLPKRYQMATCSDCYNFKTKLKERKDRNLSTDNPAISMETRDILKVKLNHKMHYLAERRKMEKHMCKAR